MKNCAVCLQIDPESYEWGFSARSVDLWRKQTILYLKRVTILFHYQINENIHLIFTDTFGMIEDVIFELITVEPLLWGHPFCTRKVAFQEGWPLVRGNNQYNYV